MQQLSPAAAPPSPTPDLHPAYRRDIDGLRAVAVLSVVLFHAFPAMLPGGFIGVDIFFIISGYLISTILLNGLRAGRFSFSDFYARRVRRIFPALALVMAGCAALGWFALFPDEYRMLGKHIFGGASFTSNFLLWNEVGYFDTAADTKPLLHLWSLAVEEQFYIVWPLVLWQSFKRGWAPWKPALLLALLSFAVNVGGVSHHASATFYSPASRMWELLLGAMLAYLGVYRRSFLLGVRRAGTVGWYDLAGPRARHWAAGAGLLLIVLGLALARPAGHFPGWWALLPTVGALLLIAAGPDAWVNRKLLGSRLLVWFGLISYPLYLWHWPLLSFQDIIEGAVPGKNARTAALLLAVALAWLTYRLLERPLRAPQHGARKVALLAGLVLALGAGGAGIYLRDGLPRRAAVMESAAQMQALKLVEDTANALACKRRFGFNTDFEYCLLDRPDQAPTVALIGDSHAYHLVFGLTRHYRALGENLWQLGTRRPYWDVPAGDDPYQKATPRMLDAALNTASVKTVVFSTYARLWRGSPDGERMVEHFRNTIKRFVESGREVIWINDIPEMDFDPRTCIKRAGVANSQTRRDCSIPRAQYDAAMADHKAAVAAVLKEFPQVKVLDASAPLCDQQRCRAIIDGKLMYRDRGHLSYEGDLYVGESLSRQLQQLGPKPAAPGI